MDVTGAEQDCLDSQQLGTAAMETLVQKKSHVRKANFSEEELTWLVNVFENTWATICDPSKTADTNRRKRMMWQKIAQEHAERFPDKPRTIDEMKNKLLKLKCEAKADWARGKITLGNVAPHPEDSEMTLMRYVHQKIISLCEKYEPESLASLQFPELTQNRSPPEGPSANSGSNSGLPHNVKIEYVLDEESSGAQSEDPLQEPWEPTPVFQTPTSGVSNGALAGVGGPASSGQPASAPSPRQPQGGRNNNNGSTGPMLEQTGGGYAQMGGRREEGGRDVPPLNSQYSAGNNDGTCQNDLNPPPNLSRQGSMVTSSSYVPETPPVLNSAVSFQQGMDERWQQQNHFMNAGNQGVRDYPPPPLNPQFSSPPMGGGGGGGGGGEGPPNLPPQHNQDPKSVITISPDREVPPSLSSHSSFNGNHGPYGRGLPQSQPIPPSHSATSSAQRADRNYAACNPSGAAAENGCPSPEMDHPLGSVRKRMRLSMHQNPLMDEIMELERSTLLIRRENLLLKQEKLKMEVALLKKQMGT